MWICYSINSSASIMILTLYKSFGIQLHINAVELVWISIVASLCNGLGRILFGYLFDRIKYKTLMSIVTAIMSLLLGTFYLCSLVHIDKGGRVMYVIWVALMHIVVGANYALYPAICVKLFGTRHFAPNYGLLFTAFSVGAIMTSIFTFHLLEKDVKLDDFMVPLVIGGAILLISFIVNQFFLGKLSQLRNHSQL